MFGVNGDRSDTLTAALQFLSLEAVDFSDYDIIIDAIFGTGIEGEIKDTDALKAAIEDGLKVVGVSINGHTYDTGNPENYVRANTAFFKKQFAKAVKVF